VGVEKVYGPVVGCVCVKVRTAPVITKYDLIRKYVLIGNIIYDKKETIGQGNVREDKM
jgi:hypothetical protein